MTKTQNIDSILIGLVFLAGATILLLPIHYIMVLFLGAIIVGFLISKPKICFYLMILTIPLTARIRLLPVSFSVNEILIAILTLSVILHSFIGDERVNLRTPLDKWNVLLILIFFAAGITSIANTGILPFLKFLEAIFVFYITVYFIRTKKATVSTIVRLIIITGIIQASIGSFQSFTGIGANFISPRNILGYFGIGSKMVWHGIGTMEHFNKLGNFLITISLFSLPIYFHLLKYKKKYSVNFGTLIIGVITSYSRGSLIGLFFGGLYFIFIKIKNKLKFAGLSAITIGALLWLKNFLISTSYISTLSPRDEIWKGVWGAILSSPRYLWFGGGLNSYDEVVYSYLPQDGTFWFAHNFYLLSLQEMGIVGSIIVFSFLIFILIDTFKKFRSESKLSKTISLSVSLTIFSIFFISIYDHAFSLIFFKVFLFLILGIAYAKDKRFYNKEYI